MATKLPKQSSMSSKIKLTPLSSTFLVVTLCLFCFSHSLQLLADECDDTCDAYKSYVADAKSGKKGNGFCTDQDYANYANAWGQAGTLCESRNNSDLAQWLDGTSIIVNATAATFCGVACGAADAYPWTTAACSISSYSAEGIDLGLSITQQIKQDKFDPMATLMGGIATEGVKMMASSGFQKLGMQSAEEAGKESLKESAKKATEEAAKKAAEAAAAKVAAEAAKKAAEKATATAAEKAAATAAEKTAEEAAKAATDEGLKQAAQETSEAAAKKQAEKIASCAALAAHTAMVGAKTYSIVKQANSYKESCAQINRLKSTNDTILTSCQQAYIDAANTKAKIGSDISVGGTAGISAKSGQSKASGSTGPGAAGEIFDSSGRLLDGVSNSATANNLDRHAIKVLNTEPKKNNELIQKVTGLSAQDFARKLASSADPAATLTQALGGISPQIQAAVAEIDAVGKRELPNMPMMSYKSPAASGSSPSSKKPGLQPFGSFGFQGVSKSSKLEFKYATPDPKYLDEGTDVFHAAWPGTIFHIVSRKIERNKQRVDNLEWATPMNRALVGLPQLKPGERVPAATPEKK